MWETRPFQIRLIYSFCSSDRGFASDFLQIPPHSGHSCPWLTVPTAKSVADSHRQVIAHAERTTKTRRIAVFSAFRRVLNYMINYLYIRLSKYKRSFADIISENAETNELQTCAVRIQTHFRQVPYVRRHTDKTAWWWNTIPMILTECLLWDRAPDQA